MSVVRASRFERAVIVWSFFCGGFNLVLVAIAILRWAVRWYFGHS